MPGELKGDIINTAYNKLRISNLTVLPSPENIEKALFRLEEIMASAEASNICMGYIFEDEPDTGSLHGLDKKYRDSVSTILAFALISDFGKGYEPDPILLRNNDSAWSFLSARTAKVNQIQYPDRMPIGSGNRFYNTYYNDFYVVPEIAPVSCETEYINSGETKDYTESFEVDLSSTETVSSFTIVSDSGLTIDSSSLSSPVVSYRITATGSDLQRVIITATIDSGRVLKRLINFQVTYIPDVA